MCVVPSHFKTDVLREVVEVSFLLARVYRRGYNNNTIISGPFRGNTVINSLKNLL